jgi:hypothetical protein
MNQKNQSVWWLSIVGLILLGLALTGCGGSSSSPIATATTTTGNMSVTNGTVSAVTPVTAPSGVTLSIPAGTVLTDASNSLVNGTIATSVSYSGSMSDLPAAAGTLPAGTTLAAFVDISMGTVKYFSNPVSLTINVTASGAKTGDAMVVYSFDTSTNLWTFAGTEIVDASGNISPRVTHLSIWAALKSATPPPLNPTGITATAGTAQTTVSWAQVTGATSYTVYYGTTAGVSKANATNSVTNVTTTTTIVPNMINGTTYYFVVTAVNGNGESIVSNEVSATPLANPSGIQVTAGDGQVTITWTPGAGDTSYNVYYSTIAGQETTAGVKVANATSPQVITGLTDATTYYFEVIAVNASGVSSVSAEKSATPNVAPQPPASPTGVKLTPAVGQVALTWNAVVGATSYHVYYLQATSQPTNAAVLATTPVSSTTASSTVTGLTSGATYYFLVTALDAGGESGTQTTAKAATVL